jgi:hypothetical protein
MDGVEKLKKFETQNDLVHVLTMETAVEKESFKDFHADLEKDIY